MSFAAPLAAIGLLGIPLLWWWYRARSQPPRVTLPSIQFLEEEPIPRGDPRKRRLDARFWITSALLAAL